MSTTVASYSFLPWLRQGISGKVTLSDLDQSVKLRATIPVELELAGGGISGAPVTSTIKKDIQLYGPGDVVGIESRAIVRVDPRNWSTNFEPNYLPVIEFYDEDFPWRYTPAGAKQDRLRPWIALVVLNESEFEDGKDIKDKPLPYITVSDRKVFPKADRLAAWAHVHVNRSLSASDTEIVSADMAAVLPKLQATLDENSDLAYSRILCPRKLEANMPYHAFLLPVFESGRLAGLGLDPGKTPFATQGAWDDYPEDPASREEKDSYPFYFRWYFRTAAVGDFEYLVRLLQPRPVDKRVGTRDLDVQRPGENVPGITNGDLGGVLKLGGALQVPRSSLSTDDQAEVAKYDAWATPYPQPFQSALAGFINLADDYGSQTAATANAAASAATAAAQGSVAQAPPVDPDPLITPPLYGRWHALTSRLLKDGSGALLPDRTNWVHELNLDPRFRAGAGFGTRIIRQNQEDYMNEAWKQIGDVLGAIQRIRAAQLAKEVSAIWYDRHLKPLQAANMERSLFVTAPIQRRVVSQGLTVHYQVSQSPIATAATSAAMRRVMRPDGRIMKRMLFTADTRADNLLTRMNAGEVAAAPPKTVPTGLNTLGKANAVLLPPAAPTGVVSLLRRFAWPPLAVLLLGLLTALLLVLFLAPPLGAVLAGVVVAGAAYANQLLRGWRTQVQRADRLMPVGQRPEAVADLPKSQEFVISAPGAAARSTTGTLDSKEATRFKEGLVSAYTLLADSAQVSVEQPRIALNLPEVTTATISAIDPRKTISKRTIASLDIPDHIATIQVKEFKDPLYYPEINTPMYKPLYDLSAELFVPNVNLIPENSITLLESNPKFIESYMVGLNFEFGSELLWREYPSDNRGSYFRQFWDVNAYFTAGNKNDPALREKLKDILPLHLWSKHSALGTHDNRSDRGAAQSDAVLAIRGELLKRYPNAVIYAQRAAWVLKSDGEIDTTLPRTLVDVTEAEAADPPRTKLRTPLYSAKIEPDIYFLGFDLTIDEAIGGSRQKATDDPGWFFVMKERPGEPRFGLDISRDGALNVWNDIAWTDVLPTASAPGAYIEVGPATATLTLAEPAAADPMHGQWAEDQAVSWSKDASSADLAYMLFRSPVLVAIHAAELLKRP
jgi:hypothetical protein